MAIKFCVKLDKSAVETLPMMKTAFGEDCLSGRQVYRWHEAFLEGREEISDEARAGRPLMTTAAFLMIRFLVDSKVPTIPQPPYSPDVASPDFFLFPRLKTPMKGHHFGTVKKVKEVSRL